MENSLSTTNNADLIRQARQGASGSSFTKIPSVPTISINNKDTEEIINGETYVKPAKKGFNLSITEGGQTVTDYYAESIEPVILLVRYQIASKNKVKPEYYSFEFDGFKEVIKVYDKDTKKVIIEGSYQTIKEHFQTGEMNSLGKPKVSFDLKFVLYVNLDGTIYKFKVSPSGVGGFIEYTNSFGDSDTYVAYKTKIDLTYEVNGTVKFWKAHFTRGEAVDLAEQIALQGQARNFFKMADEARAYNKGEHRTQEFAQPSFVETEPTIQIGEVDPTSDAFWGDNKADEEINVEQIPF